MRSNLRSSVCQSQTGNEMVKSFIDSNYLNLHVFEVEDEAQRDPQYHKLNMTRPGRFKLTVYPSYLEGLLLTREPLVIDMDSFVTLFTPLVWFWFVLMVQILWVDILKLLPTLNGKP